MEKLITRKEAAEILGISIVTLDAARNNGLISYVQYVQNGCVYFTAAGLQEYIANVRTGQSLLREAQLTVSLEAEDREPVRILDGIRDV